MHLLTFHKSLMSTSHVGILGPQEGLHSCPKAKSYSLQMLMSPSGQGNWLPFPASLVW